MASLLATWQGMCLPSSRVRVQVSTPSSLHLSLSMHGTGMSVAPSFSLRPLHKVKFEPVVASRVCKWTGKRSNKKNLVSFSNNRVKKLQMVNLQYKKVWWEAGKRFIKARLSASALRTIEKNGLEAVAKKAGIDLRKHK